MERAKLAFNAPAGWPWDNRNQLPYPYRADPAVGVPELVSRFAGTGHLRDAEMTTPK